MTDEERAELMARLAVRKAPADERQRIRIVLGCAQGEPGTHIAQRLKDEYPNGFEVAPPL